MKPKTNQANKPKSKKVTRTGLRNDLRNVATITAKLKRSTMAIAPKQMDPYLSCRMNPFVAPAKQTGGIPDGSNSSFILVDMFSADTIATQGHNCIIQTMTALPMTAMIAGSPAGVPGQLTVNGRTVYGIANLQPGSTLGSLWYPLGVPQPYSNTNYSPGTVASSQFTATKARLVAIAHRLIYTGPVNTCAGTITVTPNSCTFTEAGTTVESGSLFGVGLDVGTTIQTGGYAVPGGTATLAMDVNTSLSAFVHGSRTYRPEDGVTVTSTHNGPDFELQPISPMSRAVLTGAIMAAADYTARHNTLIGAASDGTPIGASGVTWYDNAWSNFQIAIQNPNTDATYRFETVVCIEYTPSLTSPFAALTKAKSPTVKPEILKQAEAVVVPIKPAA